MTLRQDLEAAIENLVAAEVNYVAWAANPPTDGDCTVLFNNAAAAWETITALLDHLENCHECR